MMGVCSRSWSAAEFLNDGLQADARGDGKRGRDGDRARHGGATKIGEAIGSAWPSFLAICWRRKWSVVRPLRAGFVGEQLDVIASGNSRGKEAIDGAGR